MAEIKRQINGLFLILKYIIIRTYLKNKISVQGKARNGEKAEHTRSM
jgi:hypothetical protein